MMIFPGLILRILCVRVKSCHGDQHTPLAITVSPLDTPLWRVSFLKWAWNYLSNQYRYTPGHQNPPRGHGVVSLSRLVDILTVVTSHVNFCEKTVLTGHLVSTPGVARVYPPKRTVTYSDSAQNFLSDRHGRGRSGKCRAVTVGPQTFFFRRNTREKGFVSRF